MLSIKETEVGAMGAAALLGMAGVALLSRGEPQPRTRTRRGASDLSHGARQMRTMLPGRSTSKVDRRRAPDLAAALHNLSVPASPRVPQAATVKAGRRLNRAAGVLALSVLADSGIEHYRGAFHNRAMWTPLASAALSLAASGYGVADKRVGAHRARDAVYALAAAVGLVGTGFHLYNITKRPGGFSWLNLFYAAPIGAPAALSLSGLLGFTAERVRANRPGRVPTVLGLPAGRFTALLTSVGLLGTAAEAGLLHFRGAFQNPFMVLPVTVPPATALLMARTATGKARTNRRMTSWWLRLTAALGFAGAGFHTYGVARNMGGWRNWSQNLLEGPPIPAPPSFTGLALAGLAAMGLLEDHPDA